MKDYRPNGCKMYVAVKDIVFPPFDISGEDFRIEKGEVWMLNQINISGKIWLNKQYDSESVLQISKEQLSADFVEVNLEDINMNTSYKFTEDGECTETVMLNGYEISSETYRWSFDDFCESMGYLK